MLNLGSAKVGALEEATSPPPFSKDESFQLLERSPHSPAISPTTTVPLEPPFTTPLAPFDMELMKRHNLHERLMGKESFWRGRDTSQRFLDQEQLSASRESHGAADKRARFAERLVSPLLQAKGAGIPIPNSDHFGPRK